MVLRARGAIVAARRSRSYWRSVLAGASSAHAVERRRWSPASTRSRGRRSRWAATGCGHQPHARRRGAARPRAHPRPDRRGARRQGRVRSRARLPARGRAGGRAARRPDRAAAPRGTKDPHVWLDPVRMAAIVRTVQRELTKADPKGRAVYARNAERGARRARRARTRGSVTGSRDCKRDGDRDRRTRRSGTWLVGTGSGRRAWPDCRPTPSPTPSASVSSPTW